MLGHGCVITSHLRFTYNKRVQMMIISIAFPKWKHSNFDFPWHLSSHSNGKSSQVKVMASNQTDDRSINFIKDFFSFYITAETKKVPFCWQYLGTHFLEWKCMIFFIKISLNFVPMGSVNNIQALVQITAWHWPGDTCMHHWTSVNKNDQISLVLSLIHAWFVKYMGNMM